MHDQRHFAKRHDDLRTSAGLPSSFRRLMKARRLEHVRKNALRPISLSNRALAEEMQSLGFYSPNTALIDVEASISRYQKKL